MSRGGNLPLLNNPMSLTEWMGTQVDPATDHGSPTNQIQGDLIDPSKENCVCAECTESYANGGDLSAQIERLHLHSKFMCPLARCGALFETEEAMLGHQFTAHRGCVWCQYPGCERSFTKLSAAAKHFSTHIRETALRGYHSCSHPHCIERRADLVRLTLHTYQAHPGIASARGCPDCQMWVRTDEELGEHYRTEHRSLETVSLTCPQCSQQFRKEDELYHHYWNSADHPSHIDDPEPSYMPYRCPFLFCGKAYTTEIGLGIHHALAHESMIGGVARPSSPSTVQSISFSPINPRYPAELQLDSTRESGDVAGSAYDHLEIENWILSNRGVSTTDSSSTFQSHQVTMGYIQESPVIPRPYVFSLAREQGSQPNDNSNFFHGAYLREMLQYFLVLFQVADKLTVEELFELWTFVLRSGQRDHVIRLLKRLKVQKSSANILESLRRSALATMVWAWIWFKTLINQLPLPIQNLIGHDPRFRARDTAWAILMRCHELEFMRARALPIALQMGFVDIPNRLRFPSHAAYYLWNGVPTFEAVFLGLGERARCRKVYAKGVSLSNVEVLMEIPLYLMELNEVVAILHHHRLI